MFIFFFFSFFWISFGTVARRNRYSFSCAFVTPSMCMNIALSLCFALYVPRAFHALSLFWVLRYGIAARNFVCTASFGHRSKKALSLVSFRHASARHFHTRT